MKTKNIIIVIIIFIISFVICQAQNDEKINEGFPILKGSYLGQKPPGNEPAQNLFIASTFLGGTGIDEPYEDSIALDHNGNIYISGFTLSKDFPTTQSAFDNEFNGGASDRFISKLSADLSRLLASSYIGGRGLTSRFIGGNGDELGHAIVVGSEGNVYIAGYTESPDFPVTEGSFDESYNGGRDVYIAKFDENLETLLASTFLGGTGDEGYEWPRIEMTLDENGNVIVAGLTHSVDFPTTSSAFDVTFNGGSESGDIFVTILDKDLKKLVASTYVGGEDNEWRVSIGIDDDGDIFICGETESENYPAKGGYSQELNVIKDIFISKFNKDLSELSASTFFGGNSLDEALSLDISGKGEIVITGYTESLDFPTTPGVFNRDWSGGERDAYVAVFNNSLDKLIACTLLGGSARDVGKDLTFDGHGNVYITGVTRSSDFPIIYKHQGQPLNGLSDSFIAILSPKLEKLLWSASFGGSRNDLVHCIVMDENKDVFMAGITTSDDFPTTDGAFDRRYNGGTYDCFIVKLEGDLVRAGSYWNPWSKIKRE
jgi:hypothetical protein